MIKYMVLGLGVLASTAVFGQSLEDRFRDIERRIDLLERAQQAQAQAQAAAAAAASQAQAASPQDRWKRPENWRALKRGMTQADVRGHLGEPTRVEPGSVTLWHYGPQGVGRVYFGRDSRLDAWSEPGR